MKAQLYSQYASLRVLLAPYKNAVREALSECHSYLESIDQALSEFLQARQSVFQLTSDYSLLFEQLRIPSQLATPASHALLREYANVVIGRVTNDSVTDVIIALETLHRLKADWAPFMQREVNQHTHGIAQSLDRLLRLLNNTQPLMRVEDLLDTSGKPVGGVFNDLRTQLKILKDTVSVLQKGELFSPRLRDTLLAVQENYVTLRGATSAYNSPDGIVSSEQLPLRGLKDIIRELRKNLPPPPSKADSSQSTDTGVLSSDEKQTFLIVTRHLDTLCSNASSDAEFIQTAQAERDQLLVDLIRVYDIDVARTKIMQMARRHQHEHPQLVSSLNTIITEAKASIEDELLSIVSEKALSEVIAGYLARQRYPTQHLKGVVELFEEHREAQPFCAQILEKYGSLPTSSPAELGQYLSCLTRVRVSAQELSPILHESFHTAPNQELATVEGVVRFEQALERMKSNPEQLRAQEVVSLVALAASTFEAINKASSLPTAQYGYAAEILVRGFLLESSKKTERGPTRDCAEIMTRVNRGSSTRRTVADIHATIESLLVPGLLECKNRTESSPEKRRYQLAMEPRREFSAILTYARDLASRSAARTTSVPEANRSVTSQEQPTSQIPLSESSEGPPVVANTDNAQPERNGREEKTATSERLRHLDTLVDGLVKQLEPQIARISAHSEVAESTSHDLQKVGALVSRLRSSLHAGMGAAEASTYKNTFELESFKKLRRKVNSDGSGNRTKKRASVTKITDQQIEGFVLDSIVSIAPQRGELVTHSAELFSTLKNLEKELSSRVFAENGQSSSAEALQAARVCLPASAAPPSERIRSLSQYCKLAIDCTPLTTTRDLLISLRENLTRSLEQESGSTSVPSPLTHPVQIDNAAGGAHE